MFLAAVLVMAGTVWLQMDEVAQRLAQKTKLTAEVNAPQEQVEQAKQSNVRKPAK